MLEVIELSAGGEEDAENEDEIWSRKHHKVGPDLTDVLARPSTVLS